MKYGTDPIFVDSVLPQLLSRMEQQPQCAWYLWIDSAFDTADERSTPGVKLAFNAYQSPKLQDMQHLGPLLVPLSYSGGKLTQGTEQLRLWLSHASGRPMLSLWASQRGAPDLVRHVQNWSWAQAGDGQNLLLRLADTRSACSLQALLQPEQWQALTEPLHTWLYLDRKAQVQSLPVGRVLPEAATEPAPALQAPLQLSEEQVQAMAVRAEPDGLLHYLATQMPGLAPERVLPSAMHAYAVWVCKLADEHGASHMADRITLFMSACATLGDSLKNV